MSQNYFRIRILNITVSQYNELMIRGISHNRLGFYEIKEPLLTPSGKASELCHMFYNDTQRYFRHTPYHYNYLYRSTLLLKRRGLTHLRLRATIDFTEPFVLIVITNSFKLYKFSFFMVYYLTV